MNNKLNPNFTQIPNIFFDEWLAILEKGELKVLLYVMRRTYGFQKKSDKISISQLMNGIKKDDGTKLDHGTGLSNRAIIDAINSLSEKKLILVDKKHRKTTKITLNLSETTSLDKDDTRVKQLHSTSETTSLNLVKQLHTQKKEKESIQNKDTAFDSFWSVYPKKVNRKVCENLWKTKKLNSKLEVILEFVRKAKSTERWELGYIKAPDVFLRNETWEDDLEAYKPIKATLKKVDILNY